MAKLNSNRNRKPPNKQDRITTALRLRLIALRDSHGFTNAAWGRAAKQRPQEVSRFVLGKMAFPPLDFLDALCRVFNYSLCDCLASELPQPSLTATQQRWLDKLAAMSPADYHAFERVMFREERSGS